MDFRMGKKEGEGEEVDFRLNIFIITIRNDP
jgi:hypothetical protein